VSRFGALNFLVNNAGVLHVGNVEQITEEQWDHTFNLNVRALWLLSRAVLPLMRKAGGGQRVSLSHIFRGSVSDQPGRTTQS
jgi:NAD(P)-dependent dehydrogenase (short-subunit alcohol dehydrogenase family)